MKIRRRPGFVLPTLVLLTFVLVLLTGAVLELGTVGLRTATHDEHSEQATYAAEAGLTQAVEEFLRAGDLTGTFEGEMAANHSRFEVRLYRNDTELPMQVGSIDLPPHTVYFLSTGFSENETRREAGALFRAGLGNFQVGALASRLQANASSFDAYDSTREAPSYSGPGFDPGAAELNRAILASNNGTGTVFDLADTNVAGGVYVGPGGAPANQITRSGSTVLASESTLSSPIDVEEVTLPVLPPGDGDSSSPTPTDPLDPMRVGNMNVTPQASGAVSFGNSCFSMTVQPNGDFIARENPASVYAGGDLLIQGNIGDIQAGGAPTQNTGTNKNGGAGFEYSIQEGVFRIHGSWHHFSIDSGGTISADLGPSGLVGTPSSGSLQTSAPVSAPDWLTYLLTGSGGGVNSDNPLELQPGEYDTVTVDSISSRLADNGTYVIKNLAVTGSGHLELPADRGNVTIYVTESLSIEGEDALVNASRKAPNLKIFYLGSDPVNLAGGSQSFFTLVAEDADLNLVSTNPAATDFYGALVGKNVTVDNANFHYDVATSGIGSGTDASVLTLLSRHR